MDYQKLLKEELLNNIIPFWNSMVDYKYGGFYGAYDLKNKIIEDAPKGLVYISRILYSYSELYFEFEDSIYLENATHAYKFLTEKLYDNKNKGFYWSCEYDGKVLDNTKHLYGQTFALYGLSAYYKASKSKEAIEHAKEIVKIIGENLVDFPKNYCEEYSINFKPQKNNLLKGYNIIPEITTNTLLHLAEGLGLYYEVTKDDIAKKYVKLLFQTIFETGYDQKNKNLYQFLNYKLESVIDVYSYGHNLEVSWLFHEIMEQCEINNELWFNYCINLFDKSFDLAYQNGYIINETVNSKTDYSAIWWIQAESLAALVNINQIKPNEKYEDAIKSITKFILNNFTSPGLDWHWGINQDRSIQTRHGISEMWKANYHNVRAILRILRRKI
ncbi:MAG TPA: AGE family epimerase/isomerase [Acholeplasmataceae bacterium]|nr:AGE family epimerase/isomerase [Acholeplasmataceae bacterium]